ncbi:hypothetical protein NEAUS07_2266 [Nematocida ausubeli]|nr:hypothetical protein NEAUS07_2266 [Nematocida ausubeli]
MKVQILCAVVGLFLTGKCHDSVYMGVDSSVFVPCVNTFDSSFITSGNTAGKKIEKEKTIIIDYSGEKTDGNQPIKSITKGIYFPQVIASEDMKIACFINKNVKISPETDARTVKVDDLYTEVPDIAVYKAYLNKALKKYRKNRTVLSLGMTTRGYFSPETQKTLLHAMKEVAPIAQIQLLTDGMAQAVDRILSSKRKTGHIVTYTMRGSKMAAEIFYFKKDDDVKKGSEIFLLNQEIFEGYSDFAVITLIYNYILGEIKKLINEKYPALQYDLVGTPCLSFSQDALPADEKDAIQVAEPEKTFSVEILPLIDLALQSIWKIRVKADQGSDLVIDNLDEVQYIRTLSITLLEKSEDGKSLVLLPHAQKEQIEIDLIPLHHTLMEYVKETKGFIGKMIEKTEETLKNMQNQTENKENAENEEMHRDVSIYNDIFNPQEYLNMMHSLNISDAFTPSKSDLASAPLHMKRTNITIRDKQERAKYQVEYSSTSIGDSFRLYSLNGELKKWTFYTTALNHEMEIKETLHSLITGSVETEEYKNLVKKYGKARIASLQETVNLICNGRSLKEVTHSKDYPEIAKNYQKMVSDAEKELFLNKEIETLQKNLPSLIKKALGLVKKRQETIPEPCDNLVSFLARNKVVGNEVQMEEAYSMDMPLNKKAELKRRLKTIEDGVNYRKYMIETEYTQHLEAQEKMKAEQKKAEEMQKEEEKKEAETLFPEQTKEESEGAPLKSDGATESEEVISEIGKKEEETGKTAAFDELPILKEIL